MDYHRLKMFDDYEFSLFAKVYHVIIFQNFWRICDRKSRNKYRYYNNKHSNFILERMVDFLI